MLREIQRSTHGIWQRLHLVVPWQNWSWAVPNQLVECVGGWMVAPLPLNIEAEDMIDVF